MLERGNQVDQVGATAPDDGIVFVDFSFDHVHRAGSFAFLLGRAQFGKILRRGFQLHLSVAMEVIDLNFRKGLALFIALERREQLLHVDIGFLLQLLLRLPLLFQLLFNLLAVHFPDHSIQVVWVVSVVQNSLFFLSARRGPT